MKIVNINLSCHLDGQNRKNNPVKHHGSAVTSADIVKYCTHGADLTETSV